MPELPEVETVVRSLRPDVVGRAIAGVRAGPKALRRPWKPAWNRRLTGQTIRAVRRRGKWILLDLDGGGSLLAHLGMTGRFHVVADGAWETHAHLGFRLQSAGLLRFDDPRRFGSVTLLSAAEAAAFAERQGLGPEPWDLTDDGFHDALRRTDRCLKAVLLDQRVVAGVGNIYADEALFEAQLSPARRGRQVTRPQAAALRQAIVTVLERAIERKGSTIRNFTYGEGHRGAYQDEFRAYQQTGRPCVRCERPIARLVLAGRSTHFCPACQRPPRPVRKGR